MGAQGEMLELFVVKELVVERHESVPCHCEWKELQKKNQKISTRERFFLQDQFT